MGYRGRLIYAFEATIARLDTAATDLNVPAGHPSGFDHTFGTTIKLTSGETTTVYSAPVKLRCQVETEGDSTPWDALAMLQTGDNRDSELKLVFHYRDLEDQLLVDIKGRVKLYKGDKLTAIHTKDGEEVDNYDEMGLVATELKPVGYGLSGGKRNLLVVTYRRRDRSTAEV